MNPLTPAVSALLCLTAPLSAQIYADVDTSLGTFTIKLDHINSPRTVANFIGLATGSKKWIDSSTGQVKTNTPFFTNRLFHRIQQGGFIQGGSASNEGTGGPGYVFKEETATTTFTDPFLIAMANRGPQTNSSGFFITVVPAPGFNGNYTIFGSVPADDGAGPVIEGSQNVVTAINNTPLGGSKGETPVTDVVTNSVTIRRIGAAAFAFDETAHDLPLVSAQPVTFNFPSATTTDTTLFFPQAPGTSFVINRTDSLDSWRTTERYIHQDAPASLTEFNIGALQANKARQFYSPSALITWPADAVFLDSLANQTLTIFTVFDPVPFTFTFDASGETGTWDFPRAVDPLSGSFSTLLFTPDGYGATLVMNLPSITIPYWQIGHLGVDSITPTLLTGRHNLTVAASSFHLNLGLGTSSPGAFTLTR